MPAENMRTTVEGQVTDLFGHRFVLATASGKVLADLGPKGTDLVTLNPGDHVVLSGEQKPTELKVHALTLGDRVIPVRSETSDEPFVDPKPALEAVKAAGFEPVGEPKRKPKHFEIVARRKDEHVEFHVALDGRIRNTRPVPAL